MRRTLLNLATAASAALFLIAASLWLLNFAPWNDAYSNAPIHVGHGQLWIGSLIGGPNEPLRRVTKWDVGVASYHHVRGPIREWTALRLDLTSLALASGILPAIRLVRSRRLRRRRAACGLCPTCGYDCHATPDRCPECGTDLPSTNAATDDPHRTG